MLGCPTTPEDVNSGNEVGKDVAGRRMIRWPETMAVEDRRMASAIALKDEAVMVLLMSLLLVVIGFMLMLGLRRTSQTAMLL